MDIVTRMWKLLPKSFLALKCYLGLLDFEFYDDRRVLVTFTDSQAIKLKVAVTLKVTL